MTVVAAIAHPRGVVMVADSLTNVYERPIVGGAQKILRLRAAAGEVLIGCAGSGDVPALVTTQLRIKGQPKISDARDTQAWATAVAIAVTDLALDANIRHSDGQMDATLLLGWRNRLWTLTHCQAVPHPDGLAAVGSGEGIAMGAMHALRSKGFTPEVAATEAVRIACMYDRHCGAPIQSERLTARRRAPAT